MRVFVTGATGFIGQAVVKELQAAGHAVLGLARNDGGAAKLNAAGVDAHRGELSDPASIVAGAAACDAVAHLGFIHDFSKFEENIRIDRKVVEALATSMEGTNKPLVVTFGTATVKPGGVLTEADVAGPTAYARSQTEHVVTDAAQRGVRAVVVRLPPSVHGRGEKGFVPILIDLARQKGFSAYVGDGANRWPAVHRDDAGKLYRLAIEKAAPGSILHATAEEGVAFREIARTIGEGLKLPVRSLTPEEAKGHFGWFAMFAGLDGATSSEVTRRTLGWVPSGPGLLEDVRENGYFG